MKSFIYDNLPYKAQFYKKITEESFTNIINYKQDSADLDINKIIITSINKVKKDFDFVYPSFDSLVFERQNLELNFNLNVKNDIKLLNTNYSYFKKSLPIEFIKSRDRVSLNSIKLKNFEEIEKEKLREPNKTERTKDNSLNQIDPKNQDDKKDISRSLIVANPILYNINISNGTNSVSIYTSKMYNNSRHSRCNTHGQLSSYVGPEIDNDLEILAVQASHNTEALPKPNKYVKSNGIPSKFQVINSNITNKSNSNIDPTRKIIIEDIIENIIEENKDNKDDISIKDFKSNKEIITPDFKDLNNSRRVDKKGNLIEKNSKIHKVSFVDKIGEKKFVSEIIHIENWKEYNFNPEYSPNEGNLGREDCCVPDQNKNNPAKCCLIF